MAANVNATPAGLMSKQFSPAMATRIELWPVEKLVPYDRNARTHSPEQVAQVAASIATFGFTNPILVDGEHGIIAGHGRLMAARDLGLDEVPVVVLDYLTPNQKKAYIIADNKLALNAGWDEDLLREEMVGLSLQDFDMSLTGFDEDELAELLSGDEDSDNPYGEMGSLAGSLSESFGIPPFSVLNAREGWWQARKKSWLDLGIQSELGRADGLLGEGLETVAKALGTEGGALATSTSVFDPVLAELAYKWFSPTGATILDPFAGGSVRGIVAAKCGRNYFGCDLRAEQIEENKRQAEAISPERLPTWSVGDSLNIAKTFEGLEADMLFTCPPYADLEQYSDDPNDLSNMSYEDFKKNYYKIIEQACTLLRDNSFAAIVVGEIRDKKGNYRNFVGDTIQALLSAGLNYYNEAILVTPAGSLPLRSRRAFESSRKLGKTHQNILVFVKGDGKKAAQACGECEFGNFDAGESVGEEMA